MRCLAPPKASHVLRVVSNFSICLQHRRMRVYVSRRKQTPVRNVFDLKYHVE